MLNSEEKLLLQFVCEDLVRYIVEDERISIEKAMEKLYSSLFFTKLSDMKTGLYRESSRYNYEIFKEMSEML